MVFYRFLLDKRNIVTYGEAIVYSTILNRSIMGTQEFYDTDGTFSIELVKFSVQESKEMGMGEYIGFYPPTNKYISEHTEITPQNVRIILKSLKKKRIIVDDSISCPLKLLEGGYINLPEGTGLKGSQLICYGYILARSKDYHGSIDTHAVKLAEILGITRTNVHSILSILHKKGFVRRDNVTKRLIVL